MVLVAVLRRPKTQTWRLDWDLSQEATLARIEPRECRSWRDGPGSLCLYEGVVSLSLRLAGERRFVGPGRFVAVRAEGERVASLTLLTGLMSADEAFARAAGLLKDWGVSSGALEVWRRTVPAEGAGEPGFFRGPFPGPGLGPTLWFKLERADRPALPAQAWFLRIEWSWPSASPTTST